MLSCSRKLAFTFWCTTTGEGTLLNLIHGVELIACSIHSSRGFGHSDTTTGAPRQEIIPSQQLSDWQDAITYVQSKSEVDPKRIGIWVSFLDADMVHI
jgi:hypothetical protein